MRKIIKAFVTLTFIYFLAIAVVVITSFIFDVKILYVLVGVTLLSFGCVLFVIASNKTTDSKISWIVLVAFIPIIGITTYLIFGRAYKQNPKVQAYYEQLLGEINDKYSKDSHHIIANLAQKDGAFGEMLKWNYLTQRVPAFADTGENEIFTSGCTFFNKLIEDIQAAEKYILLSFYIIANGELLSVLEGILVAKAKKGVKIYIIYDHAGSIYLFRSKSIKFLQKHGIKLIKNAPINKSLLNGTLPYRLHRKDVVIDGQISYTGGINIADEWMNSSKLLGFYNDVQIRMVGPASKVIEAIFAADWYRSTRGQEILFNSLPSARTFPPTSKGIALTTTTDCFSISNQQVGTKYSSHKSIFLSLISLAKSRIWISTPYFIPTNDIVEALVRACERGVDVRILLPGTTDKAFILDLSRLYAQQVFQAQGKIYELNNSFNHGKVTIIDADIVVVGTTNFDYRAFYLDQQTLVISKSTSMVRGLVSWWEWNFDHATKWQFPILSLKGRGYKRLLNVLKLFSPVL